MPSSIRAGELGRQREHGGDAADAKDDVAQRDRDGGADHLFDDRRVDGDPRRDLGRPVLLEEAGRQAQQVAVNGEADVGDGPFAQPRDEIEAEGGGERHHRDHSEQIVEPGGDALRIAGAGAEALVDDQLEAARDRDRGSGGEQRAQGRDDDVAG